MTGQKTWQEYTSEYRRAHREQVKQWQHNARIRYAIKALATLPADAEEPQRVMIARDVLKKLIVRQERGERV